MNDKVFLDTNILVYSYSKTEPDKQLIARELIINNDTYISTQVLQELTNTIIRKFKFDISLALAAVDECCRNNNLHTNTITTIKQAFIIADRYNFSFYDCLIISAALESGCTILYTEDMSHNLRIDSKLTLINPFK